MVSQWLDAAMDWFLSYGSWGLAVLSFSESSTFFLIPPDVLSFLWGSPQPELVWWYALITTLPRCVERSWGGGSEKGWDGPYAPFFQAETVEKVEEYLIDMVVFPWLSPDLPPSHIRCSPSLRECARSASGK